MIRIFVTRDEDAGDVGRALKAVFVDVEPAWRLKVRGQLYSGRSHYRLTQPPTN
jgi:hypothetical protein